MKALIAGATRSRTIWLSVALAALSAIAADLNERRIPTATGRRWHASSVRNVLLAAA